MEVEVPNQSNLLNAHVQNENNADTGQSNVNNNSNNNNNNNNNGLGEDETSQDSNTSGVVVKTSTTTGKKGVKRSGKGSKKTPVVSSSENNGSSVGGETPLKPSSMPRHTVNPEKRRLENEAYAAVLTAFKVQGELTWEKESLLQDLRYHLKIADDRHRMETKRLDDMMHPNRAQKRTRNEEGVSEGDESDLNAVHEEGEGPRKLQRTEGDLLTAISAPSTDSTPALINKAPEFTKPSSKKSKETPKKRAKKEEKKPGTGKYRKDAPIPALIRPKEEEGTESALPPDVVAAKEAGDESKVRENLERHKAELAAQLEASSPSVNASQPPTAASQIGFILNSN